MLKAVRMRKLLTHLCNQDKKLSPDAKVRMYLVYLKYWTLNLKPLVVYPEVLFHPNSGIKELEG